jgi:PAS domain S-box-containing protein
MSRILQRLPLMTKLLILAILPILFAAYLTFQLYQEKQKNVAQIKGYLERIEQTATIARLIDQLQLERRYSFDFAMRNVGEEKMKAQRPITDSLLKKLQDKPDKTLMGFMNYAFLDNLDSVRRRVDRKVYDENRVMHFYSSAVFRFSTIARPPSFTNEFLNEVYYDLTSQKLLSDLITYQGIISANIYNILYTKKYVVETLLGTLPSYDIYKSHERELFEKTDSASLNEYIQFKERGSLKPVQAYLSKVFASYKLDSTYSFEQWNSISVQSLNDLRFLQMKHLKNAESKIQQYYESEAVNRDRTLFLLLFFSVVIIVIAITILGSINKSLRELQLRAIDLSKGRTNIKVDIQSKDAIGSLASSICEIDNKNKELTIAAQSIGKGDFTTKIEPRSEQDRLGHAVVEMRDELLLHTNELKQSKEEFERLADFMPQIVWIADRFGKINYYNRKWYEITGASEDFTEQSWISILHPDDVGITLTFWYHSIETGEPYEVEYRFKDVRSGEYRWFLGRAVPITNEENEIAKWFGTATDIHDQKMQKHQLEELVAERTFELNRSNEDLQQFAHVASHDLKEPLRKISTFSQRLELELGEQIPEKGKIYLQKLQSSSQRMTEMIDGILNYSVVNATEQTNEVVDLNLVFDAITNDLELVIMQKEARVDYQQLPMLKGASTLLYQLFYNLVNNALKFTKPGVPPEITISARKVSGTELDGIVEGKKAAFYHHISVEDNGIGFNQEYADHMFNVFTRLNGRDKYEGTGLGLALCRKIVHRHHGIIYATGKEGTGSAFNILLPADS